jgi:hypothetical protein
MKAGQALRELAVLEHKRLCRLRHRLGADEERTCFLGAEDRLYVAWGVAGDYEISIWSGKVRGTPWILRRGDLAWFRARSTRWAARRDRFQKFLTGA